MGNHMVEGSQPGGQNGFERTGQLVKFCREAPFHQLRGDLDDAWMAGIHFGDQLEIHPCGQGARLTAAGKEADLLSSFEHRRNMALDDGFHAAHDAVGRFALWGFQRGEPKK